MPRGQFLTLEGGEGVGKSTNLEFIHHYLTDRGIEVRVTREPGGTQLGESIRQLLLGTDGESPEPLAELLLVFAARAQHLARVIEPALSAGVWVLCDRFTDATYAYQGYARGLSLSAIASLEALVQASRQPDLSILLDVDPAVGLARASTRAELDRFELESAAFFDAVRAGYLARVTAQPERWLVVDAGQSLDSVQRDVGAGLGVWMEQLNYG